jgi:RHS repeat-associated protein
MSSSHLSPNPHSIPRGRLGFNGQWHEPGECWQFLGNGYRIYNPVLMRFYSPDSMSPFGKGGINAYAYCSGEPVNWVDPSGHWSFHALLGLSYKIKTTLVTPVFVATAATLAAAGVAVASQDKTQRALAIVGTVIAAAGALVGARYAWTKGRTQLTPRSSAASSNSGSTETTSLPGTSPVTPLTPSTSAPISPASSSPRHSTTRDISTLFQRNASVRKGLRPRRQERKGEPAGSNLGGEG